MLKKMLALAVLMAPAGDDAGGAAPPAPEKKAPPIQGKDVLFRWLDGEGDDIKKELAEDKLSRSHLKAAVEAGAGAKEGSARAKACAEIQAFLTETSKGKGGGPRRWTEGGDPLVGVTHTDGKHRVLRFSHKDLPLDAVYGPAEVDTAGNVILTRYTGPVVTGQRPGAAKDDEDDAPPEA